MKLKDFKYIKEFNLFISDMQKVNEFHYSDGDVNENYIIDVMDKVKDISSSSSELIKHVKDWPSRYHFSKERANVFRIFDFSKTSRILELGSGMGAVTRYLGENYKKVDAVEGSLRRALATRKRMRDLDSVKVHVSNFNDLTFENALKKICKMKNCSII